MVGRIISHYRIIERLGEGGMGVVYRAEDLKLGRDVALKFLPPALARDEEAHARFIREAKAASALDHPNVCTVHEIDETEDGQTFIVMSFYGSETLEQIIKQGPLPIEKALGFAIQVAQGLTKAHAEGIAHRDIKPANIMVTREKAEVSGDSRVKIVDFGLAAIAGATRLTREGMTVGTISYMSPEQARGGEIDRRCDIWSLGVVLYEMVTGQAPFKGDYQEAVIYAIVHEAPEPLSGLRTGVPLELDRVVLKALAKRPEERYQHMDEMLVDLTTLRRKLDAPKHGGLQPVPPPAPKRWTVAYASVGLLALATLGILFFRPWSSRQEAVAPPARVQFTSYPGMETTPTFSPDGNQIAFVWQGENQDNWDIYVKQIGVGTYEATRLTDNPNRDTAPSWSPDGNYIAFLREDEKGISIYRKPVLGGIEEKLTEVRTQTILSWTPDSRSIVFVDRDSVNVQRAVYLYSIETEERQKLTDPPQGQDDLLAFVSPDGERLAITRRKSTWDPLTPDSNPSDMVTDLFAIPLSGGEPRRLTFDKSSISGLAWSPDSREIIFSSSRKERHDRGRLWRISPRGGDPVLIPSAFGSHTWPAVSPDGLRLACAEQISTFRGIWEYDLTVEDENGRGPRQIARSSADEASAEYSPDGSKIVFASNRSGNDEIWVCERDGRNPFRLTNFDGPRTGTPRWSPDGRFIAFDSYTGPNNPSAFVISATGGRPRRLTPDSLRAAMPFWSPDGRWIYFASPDDSNIWKMSSGGGIPIQVTFNLGIAGGISPDGNWIYYTKPGGSLWRMPATDGDESKIIVDSFSISGWGDLVVFDEGIYFRDQATIRFKDLEFGNIETVANLVDPGGYMHISPDRKHALVSYGLWSESDIVLFENWR